MCYTCRCGRSPSPGESRASTVAVVVEGVYARGVGVPCYDLAPPGGEGALIGAATLARLLRQPPTARPSA